MEDNLYKFLGEEIRGVKGQDAIYALIKRQAGYVKNAFRRDDIGYINLIWGDESCGLMHIINQRKKQGINAMEFLSDIESVIINGVMSKNKKGRFELLYKNRIAIISPELRGNKMTFLLTAYKTRKK